MTELKESSTGAQSNNKKWQKRIGWGILIGIGLLVLATVIPWIVMFIAIVTGNFAP